MDIATPPASEQSHTHVDRPNILLVLTDQQRFDSLGCYGADFAHTPNLDRLASQGVRFDRCYVNNTVCTPSRASLMTGLELPQHGVHRLYDRLDDGHQLFAEQLQRSGYRTGLIGKLHVSDYKHEAVHRHPHDGFDVYEWCHEPALCLDAPHNGYSRYLQDTHPAFFDRLRRDGRAIDNVPPECHMSYWAAETTIRFIEETPAGQPFFAMMSLFDPHNPYHDFPDGYENRVDQRRLPEPLGQNRSLDGMPSAVLRENAGSHMGAHDAFTPTQLQEMRVGYHASVAFLDEQVGRVLSALDRLEVAEDTLVIFTSDHGDMLGDHRLLVKGAFFYDACTRVPLLMRWPGEMSEGQTEKSPVQLHDLAATILHAAHLGHVARAEMPTARDLLPLVRGEVHDRPAVCHYLQSGVDAQGRYFDPPIFGSMICDGRYKLNTYWSDASLSRGVEHQLFDLKCDPGEFTNLFDKPAARTVRRRLQAMLSESLQRCAGAPPHQATNTTVRPLSRTADACLQSDQ